MLISDKHQVGHGFEDGGKPFAAVMGDGHLIAAVDQILGDQGRSLTVVLDAKDLFCRFGHAVNDWRLGGTLALIARKRGRQVLRQQFTAVRFPVVAACAMVYVEQTPPCRRILAPMVTFMRQPQSIRFHLAAVFLLFFSLVTVAWDVQHLASKQFQSAVGGRCPNLAADHSRARRSQQLHFGLSRYRGQQSIVVGPGRAAATEKEMAELDRTIAEAERSFEQSATMRRRTTVPPVQGALDRLSHDRQPDAGAVAQRPQTRCAARSTTVPRASPTTPQATRSASSPTRRWPTPRSPAIDSASLIGMRSGSFCWSC